MDRVNQWAARMAHEAQFHGVSSFLTLTYDDENLPENNSLVKRHVQLFIKRLRKSVEPKKLLYFACGEYGDTTQRPHYHAIMFGYWPDDARALPGKRNLFSSESLRRLWGHGMVSVGGVTPQSCAYVARYSLKRVNGKRQAEHYGDRLPEFALMSTRPAIGLAWIQKYGAQTYETDNVISSAREVKPPRYYDKVLQRTNPEKYAEIKQARREKHDSKESRTNITPRRLKDREVVAKARQALKKGTL